MPSTDTATGATPGDGATPAQAGQQQPTTTPPTGATPPAGTSTDPAATSPATGEAALGDVGKQILADARRTAKDAEARAKAAEAERDALKTATQTDQEKALDTARNEGQTEAEAKWTGIVRRAQVERALTAAGVSQSELVLAASAPEFTSLELDEDGQAKELDKAVDTFKASHSKLFEAPGTPQPGGAWGGSEGGGKPKVDNLQDAVAARLATQAKT